MIFTGCSSSTPGSSPASSSPIPTEQPESGSSSDGNESPENTPEDLKKFSESPMLAAKVQAGELPPIEERLPKEPKLVNEIPDEHFENGKMEIGQYGGTMRLVSPTPEWDGNVFVMCNEALLNTPGIIGEEITPNVLRDYEVSPDQKEFTFYMREGLKWSDGQPVTTEDIRFTYENVLKNEELTPAFPNWLRSGGKADGEPMDVQILDPYTFKINFKEPYGGFLLEIAIRGWKGYTELLKPKHYLEKFHVDFTPLEELEPLIEEAGFQPGEWVNLFNLKDVTNWELSNSQALGFPSLQPWIMVQAGENKIYERNPYYFKVDAEGNQLPYIDKLESNLVQDAEAATLREIAGEVDYSGSPSLSKLPLYKENESKGGYKVVLTEEHISPIDIHLNLTNKDAVWRKVVQDVRFRKALNMAINREEIIESLYFGFAKVPEVSPAYDVDQANKLLDEMGMDKRDSQGWRLGPDGKVFEVPFEIAAHNTEMQPLGELLVEFWKQIGIKTTVKTIDTGLHGTRNAANELKATMMWTHTPLWYMKDLGQGYWAPLWSRWYDTKGKEGEEPPADVIKFYDLVNSILILSPEEGKKAYQEVLNMINTNDYYFITVDGVNRPSTLCVYFVETDGLAC